MAYEVEILDNHEIRLDIFKFDVIEGFLRMSDDLALTS